MSKKSINKLSILLNIILILFLAFYFLVSFLNYGFLKTTFTPICFLVDSFQGTNYTPAWCTHLEDNVVINQNKNVNTNKNTNVNAQIANPASEECVVKGAKVEMYSDANGQFGVCVFPDKSICEEWTLYRGECKQGDCYKACKYSGTTREGWYNSCTNQLLVLGKCGTNTNTAPDDAISGTIGGIKPITLTSPQADAQLSSPFTVVGSAKISSDKVYIRIKNTTGKVLIEETALLGEIQLDGYAGFSRKISYEFSTTKEGVIEVYDLSASGAEENLVSIPVKF
jgi:putative hemolysin